MNRPTPSQSRPTGAHRPGANEPCWCGSGQKYKRCHKEQDAAEERMSLAADAARHAPPPSRPMLRPVPAHIIRPDYAETGYPRRIGGRDAPIEPEALARLRRACQAAIQVVDHTARIIAPGVATDALDARAHAEIVRLGGYPSPLNYKGFPKSICVSRNEVICHGIPADERLESGDIVTVDVTVYLEGMHGDLANTYYVGEVDEKSRLLTRVTRECLELGAAAVRPGRPLSDIGRAIEAHATAHGFGVVRAFCGHGIRDRFHAALQVPHYYEPSATTILEPGMTFTIEPMVTMGTWRHHILDDGWTAVTTDRSRCAQFEHTIVVTDRGAEVLTARAMEPVVRGE